MSTPVLTKATPKRKRKIPDYLVYEVMDGKPVYYRGYQSVLKKTKTLEEIMGCSSLQAELVSYLLSIISLLIVRNFGFIPTKSGAISIQTIIYRTTLPFSTKRY